MTKYSRAQIVTAAFMLSWLASSAHAETVDLQCTYHYTFANGGAAEQEVHLGIDYAGATVRIFSAPGDRGLIQQAPSDVRIENGDVIYHAAITDDAIRWDEINASGIGAALEPNQWGVRQVAIDRKTGQMSLVFDPRYTNSLGTGSCTKRSSTNKF